jgi:hypothetical protein
MSKTKNYKQVKNKIEKFVKHEETEDNLVIQKGNTFLVYSEYKIIKDKHNFKIYMLDGNKHVNTVFNSSTAISWCNAHKGNDIDLANDIIATDRAIEFVANDIAYTKIIIKLKSTPHSKQSILLARLTEYLSKQLQLKLNLHKYIQRSKQIKDKGFLNEFTTTSNPKKFKRVR